jgi:hypothetical protein
MLRYIVTSMLRYISVFSLFDIVPFSLFAYMLTFTIFALVACSAPKENPLLGVWEGEEYTLDITDKAISILQDDKTLHCIGYKFYYQKLYIDNGYDWGNHWSEFDCGIEKDKLLLGYNGIAKKFNSSKKEYVDFKFIAGRYFKQKEEEKDKVEEMLASLALLKESSQSELTRLEIRKSKLKERLNDAGVFSSEDIQTKEQRQLAKMLADVIVSEKKFSEVLKYTEDKVLKLEALKSKQQSEKVDELLALLKDKMPESDYSIETDLEIAQALDLEMNQ